MPGSVLNGLKMRSLASGLIGDLNVKQRLVTGMPVSCIMRAQGRTNGIMNILVTQTYLVSRMFVMLGKLKTGILMLW